VVLAEVPQTLFPPKSAIVFNDMKHCTQCTMTAMESMQRTTGGMEQGEMFHGHVVVAVRVKAGGGRGLCWRWLATTRQASAGGTARIRMEEMH